MIHAPGVDCKARIKGTVWLPSQRRVKSDRVRMLVGECS